MEIPKSFLETCSPDLARSSLAAGTNGCEPGGLILFHFWEATSVSESCRLKARHWEGGSFADVRAELTFVIFFSIRGLPALPG